jgi:hypothetical protein
MSADDALVSGDGICTGFDTEGESASFWSRVDKADTSDRPGLCGSWGYFNGTGKYDGIEGVVTRVRDSVFHNGSSGTWRGTAKPK